VSADRSTNKALSQAATITVTEAAALLGISRSAAYEAITNGSFPVAVLTINGRHYIPRAPLLALLGLTRLTTTQAAEQAAIEERLHTLYRDLRALHGHLGIELDRLAAMLGEAVE
jgi:excisionase family DNA binding protein